MAIPFNQLPIGEGLDPAGNSGASFFIDQAELERLEREGPDWKLDDARFIDEVVRAPDAIFEARGQPGRPDTFAYAVRPTVDPENEESQALPRYGVVFVAFVAAGVGGYLVGDWEWRDEDAATPGHPVNWAQDFARRTWHRT